tara:strand:+ start:102 stop:314 length:213 start_codon:yes stop_codon:yes gene_type:complete
MIKKICVILFLLLLTDCSFDTSSGIWENKKEENKITELNMDDLYKNLSIEEYKLIIIEYGKNSEFPDINK